MPKRYPSAFKAGVLDWIERNRWLYGQAVVSMASAKFGISRLIVRNWMDESRVEELNLPPSSSTKEIVSPVTLQDQLLSRGVDHADAMRMVAECPAWEIEEAIHLFDSVIPRSLRPDNPGSYLLAMLGSDPSPTRDE